MTDKTTVRLIILTQDDNDAAARELYMRAERGDRLATQWVASRLADAWVK